MNARYFECCTGNLLEETRGAVFSNKTLGCLEVATDADHWMMEMDEFVKFCTK